MNGKTYFVFGIVFVLLALVQVQFYYTNKRIKRLTPSTFTITGAGVEVVDRDTSGSGATNELLTYQCDTCLTITPGDINIRDSSEVSYTGGGILINDGEIVKGGYMKFADTGASLFHLSFPKPKPYKFSLTTSVGDTVMVAVPGIGNRDGIVRTPLFRGQYYVNFFKCDCDGWYSKSIVMPYSHAWGLNQFLKQANTY